MEITSPLFLTISIFILVILLFIFAKFSKKRVSSVFKQEIYNSLAKIRESLKNGNSAVYRDSIVRLDTLLSKVLQKKMSNSLQCGENLKKLKGRFRRDFYDDIWHYHKLRNKVVHDDISVKEKDAKAALYTYSKAIEKLLK